MPDPLLIPGPILDDMIAHCRREAPCECCGILGGAPPRVSSIHPLTNLLASESRYEADSRQVIRAHVELRERGGEFLAIYHSHPRWQAVPSRTDLEQNHYGDLPRIIVSLLEDVPDIRAWRLEATSFEELPWHAIEPPGRSRYTVGPILFGPEVALRTLPMQQTLIIFKPDCVQRRLVGEILGRFESKGLQVAALKLLRVPRSLAETHYAEHRERPFFGGLIDFLTGGPVIVGMLRGPDAIAVVRKMLGKTNGAEAEPGSIRGDYSISKQNNLIHGSDGAESAEREIALWFRPEELVEYEIEGSRWVVG